MASMAPDVAVIGGSGLYRFLPDNAHKMPVSTPFGETSAPMAVGCAEKRAVASSRHGPGHRYPARRIPARANLWALRSLGVRQVLAPCAAGLACRRPGGRARSSSLTSSSTARVGGSARSATSARCTWCSQTRTARGCGTWSSTGHGPPGGIRSPERRARRRVAAFRRANECPDLTACRSSVGSRLASWTAATRSKNPRTSSSSSPTAVATSRCL